MTAVTDLLEMMPKRVAEVKSGPFADNAWVKALITQEEAHIRELRAAIAADAAVVATDKVDELIATLESKGLGWTLDHTGILIEARIWDWPNVVGRYRPATVEPLHDMLMKALAEVKP